MIGYWFDWSDHSDHSIVGIVRESDPICIRTFFGIVTMANLCGSIERVCNLDTDVALSWSRNWFYRKCIVSQKTFA